jgi:hypothetical protein
MFVVGCPGDVVPLPVPTFWVTVENYNNQVDVHNFHYTVQFKDSASVDLMPDTVYYYTNPTMQQAFFSGFDITGIDYNKTIFVKGYYYFAGRSMDTVVFDTITIGPHNYEITSIVGKGEGSAHSGGKYVSVYYDFGATADSISTQIVY